MIGTGIFTLTGIEARNHAGPAIVVSFAIAGVVSMLAALCYAELAAAVPTAGSSYTYAYTTIGEIFAWIIAWDLILEFALGAAVVSRGWSAYLQDALGLPTGLFGESAPVNVGAVLIAAVLGVVAAVGHPRVRVGDQRAGPHQGRGVRLRDRGRPVLPARPPTGCRSSRRRGPSTDDASGLAQPLWQWASGVQPSAFGFAGVLVAAGVVFFAYSGFEAVANLGEETENPGRDMPRGLIGTLAICTALYLLVCLVLTGMVSYADLDEGAPISDAFRQVGLGWAGFLIGLAAVAGLSSVILVDLVAMGRIGFALSRDGLLPASFGRVHPRFRTPTRITVVTTAAVCLLAAFVPLDTLAEMVSIGTLFAFVVVSVAVAVLRRTAPQMRRPFRTPLVPLLPVVSALSCVALMASLAVDTWIRFVVWLVIGLVVYLGYGRRHSVLARAGVDGAADTTAAGAGR